MNNVDAVTFNPYGAGKVLDKILENSEDKTIHSDRVVNYVRAKDPFSRVNESNHIGATYEVSGNLLEKDEFLKEHKAENMDLLKNRKPYATKNRRRIEYYPN